MSKKVRMMSRKHVAFRNIAARTSSEVAGENSKRGGGGVSGSGSVGVVVRGGKLADSLVILSLKKLRKEFAKDKVDVMLEKMF